MQAFEEIRYRALERKGSQRVLRRVITSRYNRASRGEGSQPLCDGGHNSGESSENRAPWQEP